MKKLLIILLIFITVILYSCGVENEPIDDFLSENVETDSTSETESSQENESYDNQASLEESSEEVSEPISEPVSQPQSIEEKYNIKEVLNDGKLFIIWNENKSGRVYGLINDKEDILIKCIFESIELIRPNFILGTRYISPETKNLYAVVDIDGNVVAPAAYNYSNIRFNDDSFVLYGDYRIKEMDFDFNILLEEEVENYIQSNLEVYIIKRKAASDWDLTLSCPAEGGYLIKPYNRSENEIKYKPVFEKMMDDLVKAINTTDYELFKKLLEPSFYEKLEDVLKNKKDIYSNEIIRMARDEKGNVERIGILFDYIIDVKGASMEWNVFPNLKGDTIDWPKKYMCSFIFTAVEDGLFMISGVGEHMP